MHWFKSISLLLQRCTCGLSSVAGSIASRKSGFPMLVLGIMALSVIALEPYTINLFRHGHFNWVSHHSLAIAVHSTPDMMLVGYSCKLIRADGGVFYDYFNRYPFPFAFLSGAFLRVFRGGAELFLYMSRQLMNTLFLANAVIFVALGRVLRFSVWASVFGLLVVASSRSLLYYKSMYHFDQPALLGLSILIFFIALFWAKPALLMALRLPVLMAVSTLAVLSGRSGSVLIFLFVCLVLKLVQPHSFWPLAGRDFCLSLVASLFVLFLFTGHSVLVEARANSVHWVDTSVVQSAMRRIGFSTSGFSDDNLKTISWPRAAPRMLTYALRFCSPAFGVLVVVGVVRYLRHRGLHAAGTGEYGRRSWLSLPALRSALSRPVFALTTACFLTGLAWCIGMKNLVAFHDYSTIYLVPFLYLIALSLIDLLPPLSDRARAWLLAFLLAIFVFSLLAVQVVMGLRPTDLRAHSSIRIFLEELDMFAASDFGDSSLPVLRDQSWLPGNAYAQCLYLENPLLEAGDAALLKASGSVLQLANPPRIMIP